MGVVLLSAYALTSNFDVTFGSLFRDVSVVADAPRFAGIYSQIGLLLWALGLGALFLATGLSRGGSPFLIGSLLLTFILMVDDTFLLHERAGEAFGGSMEKLVFVGYGIALLVYLVKFLPVISGSAYVLLGLALFCFGISMGVDLVPQFALYIGRQGTFLLEDGAKLTGILFWTTYQFANSYTYIRSSQRHNYPPYLASRLSAAETDS